MQVKSPYSTFSVKVNIWTIISIIFQKIGVTINIAKENDNKKPNLNKKSYPGIFILNLNSFLNALEIINLMMNSIKSAHKNQKK